jgi:F-type H+-transporting ATPase subunit b
MKRTIVSATLLLAVALAAPAFAAEGGLQIFPDFQPFAPSTWPGSRFVQLLVLFVLLILPVNRLVLQPLLRVLDERGARIEGARKRAHEIGAQADGVFARYQAAIEAARKQADELRNRALDGARGDQAKILADARRAAESEMSEARSGVASALTSARAGLRAQTEALAREAAERVLGRTLS